MVPEARHLPPRLPLRRALADGRALLPAIDEFDREDLVWTDLSTRPRVHVVRSGLLLSKVYTSDDQEFPYALFSEGFVSGLTELYTPFVASSFYYLQGIIPGQICRFDSDDVREIVDGCPPPSRWPSPTSRS